VTINAPFFVAALGSGSSQVAVLGATTGTSNSSSFGSAEVSVGRDLTLQAATGVTVTFSNFWSDLNGDPNPAVGFTIGSSGNAGTVVLASSLLAATFVKLVAGTVRLSGGNNRINTAAPVTVESATIEVQSARSQSLDSLTVNDSLTIDGAGSLTVSALSGSGDIIQSDGTFTIDGTNTLTGTLTFNGGTTVVNQIVSGPALVTSATFTASTLTVAFSGTPASGNQFVLLSGPTGGSYSPVLTGAGGATGTYNSSTSTLTID
jgi:hypothetical protein